MTVAKAKVAPLSYQGVISLIISRTFGSVTSSVFFLELGEYSLMIAGLILAAGAGRRMGMPKAILEIGGVRLVDHAVSIFNQAGVAKIFVVLGAWVGPVDGATVIVSEDWQSGMASSLKTGLSHLSGIPEIDSVVLSLVDLAGVTSVGVQTIAQTPGDLVVATYSDAPGHPVKFSRFHWAGIMDSAHGNVGARDYLATRSDVHYLILDDIAAGIDLDTKEDVRSFLNR